MFFLSHIKSLCICILLPSLIVAWPQASSTPASLPASLQQVVPACAQPLLRTLISDRFPVACTAVVDVNLRCLCSHYSIDGDALGEVALESVYASCSSVDRSVSESVYNVCLGQQDAVRPTHTALTVTAASTQSPKVMASSISTVTSTHPESLLASSRQTRASSFSSVPTQTLVADSITLSSSRATAPSLPSANTASAPTNPSRTMTPAQIAGLSVAAAAAFSLAVGLMVVSICLRRRRQRKTSVNIGEDKRKERAPTPTKNYSTRFSRPFLLGSGSSQSPGKRLPPLPHKAPKGGGVGTVHVSRKNQSPSPYSRQENSNTKLYTVRTGPEPSAVPLPDYSTIHPAFRPKSGNPNNTSNTSLPLDQIGLAISAELPASSVPTRNSPSNSKPETGPSRPKSVRESVNTSHRPDSAMTQTTVFEEDVSPRRRRSSRLLPTPPIPVPPIRTLQPSRQLALNPADQSTGTGASRQQGARQPGLFLDIPVRYSRSQPVHITPSDTSRIDAPAPIGLGVPLTAFQAAPAPIGAQTVQRASVYDPYQSILCNGGNPYLSNEGDIPDYYFTAHKTTPNPSRAKASPASLVRPKDSPRLINIRPKRSSSTVSRETSTATRNSTSSQTSFESVSSDDPTPEEEDDKQLSDIKLSPVAESPISNLRYPKVPRASNQLVPRSPKSPQSQRSNGSSQRVPSPHTLLAKRRGEDESLRLQRQLHIGFGPTRDDVRIPMQSYRQHVRSSSSIDGWSPHRSLARSSHSRSQSGQWPKSPAMYDADVVLPLNIRPKQASRQPPLADVAELKSPMWVPSMTPSRKNDDLFISVSYSKPGR